MIGIEIIKYTTPNDFLLATEDFLMKDELVNNLILGLTKAIPNQFEANDLFVFLNLYDKGILKATIVKTSVRILIYCPGNNREYISQLVNYCKLNNISAFGVVGVKESAAVFAELFTGKFKVNKGLLAHSLNSLSDIKITEGNLHLAVVEDMDLLTDWVYNFSVEAKSFPIPAKDDVFANVKDRISKQELYCWEVNGNLVSIAAIVRKTKNYGIVGYVYTPSELRGKGYATAIVKVLSQLILKQGFKCCGLFTDIENPTSNKIYTSIGYKQQIEFADLEFLKD